MKTNLLLLLSLLFLLSSCLETGSDDTEPAGNCTLTSSSTTLTHATGSRFSYTLNYKYNSEGLLESIAAPDTSNMYIKLAYDEKKRLVLEKMDSYTWKSEYNTAGQLVKQTRTNEFAPARYETLYLEHHYNPKGQLQETKEYVAEEPEDVLVYTYRYTYSNGQVQGIEKISAQDTRHYGATFLTDSNKNPLPVLPMHMLYLFRDDVIPVSGLLENNITTFAVQHGEESAGFKNYTAAYEYNSAGYPVAVTRTFANGSKEETRYQYSCK